MSYDWTRNPCSLVKDSPGWTRWAVRRLVELREKEELTDQDRDTMHRLGMPCYPSYLGNAIIFLHRS